MKHTAVLKSSIGDDNEKRCLNGNNTPRSIHTRNGLDSILDHGMTEVSTVNSENEYAGENIISQVNTESLIPVINSIESRHTKIAKGFFM